MEKTNKVLILSSIVLVGFFIAVIFHYVLGFYLGWGHLFNTFLSSPDTAFSDFTSLLPKIKDLQPYSPPADWQNYFPLSFVLIYPFVFLKNKFVAYFIFICIFLTFFIFTNVRYFNCEDLSKLKNFQNIFILTFLSYPFLYLIDRGNLDIIIFIALTGFACFFESGKYKLSALCLAIANAMKPFGFLFLILLLIKKKYKEFFLSIGLTFLLIIGGFLFFKGNILSQFNILLQSWGSFSNTYFYSNNDSYGMINGSSFFMLLKLIFCQLTATPIISPALLFRLYGVLNLFIFGVVLFLTFREKIYWKQLALLTFYMAFIPPAMYDYRLIFLFIPLWFFVNTKEESKFDLIYVILFGLFLLPKYFVIPEFLWGLDDLAFSVSLFLNPIIMIIFTGLIIKEQLISSNKLSRETEKKING